MSIRGFRRIRRPLCGILILAFLFAFSDLPLLARDGDEPAVRVSNQDIRIEGDVAFISYDLEGPDGGTYVIAVELRRESDPSFSFIPSGLSGDIGDVKSPGPKKIIRWEYLKDFPVGLHGEDFYVTISARRSGGFPWVLVGLGSAAVAGAIVAVISAKSSGPASPAAQQPLPLPPARNQ